MSATARDAFERTFPRTEWYSGYGRNAWLWAVLNGLLLGGFLLQAGLLISLMIDKGRGEVRLTGAEIEEFEHWTGLAVTPIAGDAIAPEMPQALGEAIGNSDRPLNAAEPVAEPVVVRHIEDSGLLPSVWRNRKTWWGAALAWAYRACSWLRNDSSALLTLLSGLGMTWMVRLWVIGQLRTVCRHVGLDVSARMRRQLHRQALRLGTEDLDGRGVSEAQTLFCDDGDRLRDGVFAYFSRATRYPAELAFLLVTALSVEVLLSVQWMLLSIIGWMALRRSLEKTEQWQRLAEDRSERELRQLGSTLGNARLIRGYAMDAVELEQFQSRMERYVAQLRIQNRLLDDPLWLRTLVNLGLSVLVLFMLLLLTAKVLTSEISLPGAAVFLAAYGLALYALNQMRGWGTLRNQVNVVADRLWRYLDQLPTVSQAVGAKFLQPLSRRLHVENLTYQTSQKRLLLDRVELQLNAGRTYALVSLDPMEAKAFALLLPRFLEPQSGRILFDGEDIAWGTLESLRAETVFVSSDDPPLPGSILDNIRAGRSALTLAQVTDAAKEARAHNFITRLPLGYETQLTGQDDPLDAGQRFRLALARALLQNPAVLIIEEPGEALDDDAKQLLDDTYSRICRDRTVFFLPARLSTVRRADEVVVFRNGRVEAIGTHAALVKDSRLYQHWEYVHFHQFRHDAPA